MHHLVPVAVRLGIVAATCACAKKLTSLCMNACTLTRSPHAPQRNACWRKRSMPARVVRAGDDDVCCLALEHVREAVRRVHRLVGRDLRLDAPPDVRQAGDVVARHRLLDPVEVVAAEPRGCARRQSAASHASFGSTRSSRSGPIASRTARDTRLVVASDAASDLQIDHVVVGQRARVRCERLRVVALQEAEVVELVVHPAAEERARGTPVRAPERVPARRLHPGRGRTA